MKYRQCVIFVRYVWTQMFATLSLLYRPLQGLRRISSSFWVPIKAFPNSPLYIGSGTWRKSELSHLWTWNMFLLPGLGREFDFLLLRYRLNAKWRHRTIACCLPRLQPYFLKFGQMPITGHSRMSRFCSMMKRVALNKNSVHAEYFEKVSGTTCW